MIAAVGIFLCFLAGWIYVFFIDGKTTPPRLAGILVLFLAFTGMTLITISLMILAERYLP